ncbi:MAG: hypothetical protein ABIX37_04220 [Gammaproteobacteria bacterium]
MRSLVIMAILLISLQSCIHLPPDVAQVVQQQDPAPMNHFRRSPAPAPAGPASR